MPQFVLTAFGIWKDKSVHKKKLDSTKRLTIFAPSPKTRINTLIFRSDCFIPWGLFGLFFGEEPIIRGHWDTEKAESGAGADAGHDREEPTFGATIHCYLPSCPPGRLEMSSALKDVSHFWRRYCKRESMDAEQQGNADHERGHKSMWP